MKIKKSSFISLLLLLVFILTSATSILANSRENPDLYSHQGDYFKSRHNAQAVIFETGGKENFTASYKDYPSLQDLTYINGAFKDPSNGNRSKKLSFPGYEFNTRHLLRTQIFPFHFFW